MSPLDIAPVTDGEIAEVTALWARCGLTRPWNDPAADISLARRSGHADVLIGHLDGAVVASAMVGHDGHRGWVYYVAVDPQHRKQGFGRAIMDAAETWLRDRGIAKLLLLIRGDNTGVQAFYESLDFLQQDRIVLAKWLDGRAPTP